MLNPFNRPCTIPRGFAVATLSHAVLGTDSECKQGQHSPRELTSNSSHAQASSKTAATASQPRNIVAAYSSSSSSKRAEKPPTGRLEAFLQRAQQTSDTNEHLDSARAQPKVQVTSSEKISYLR